MDLQQAVTEERLRVADMLDTLTDEQWQTPSWCEGWTVAQVVGHMLVGPVKGLKGSLPFMLKAFGRLAVANDLGAKALAAEYGPAKLAATLREFATSGFKPPGFGLEAPLTDAMIHGQDIAQPLGITLDVPVDRWVVPIERALDSRYALVSARSKLKGLEFAATDLDLTVGEGLRVEGPAASLASAMWGRAGAAAALEGEGVATLRNRLA